ncbi:MAG: metal ABC transporter ATP-binding protein [Oscillospiraceae bacterium]|jgi:zinc transport system ATP-binding protein|nr:metal ABC transporter ATP-binding protein [Oscillospiraceae bacterium]
MALITCQDASFAYEGKTAVSGLHFAVHRGDYLCVVGENGSGKSTLMQGLLRLKAPQTGCVLMGDGLRPNEIGYLPQQTAVQKDFPASVYEVVLSGCLSRRGPRPFYTRRDKADAENNMERLGLTALRGHCYRELSGGQQQRVRLARALCATKTLLLLDEPVAGLDPVMTGDLYRLIRDLNRAGLTVIMVSHDVRSAVREASHILQLQHTQVFFGKTEDYVTSRAGAEFLGLPPGDSVQS